MELLLNYFRFLSKSVDGIIVGENDHLGSCLAVVLLSSLQIISLLFYSKVCVKGCRLLHAAWQKVYLVLAFTVHVNMQQLSN
jgi:hypothetical protein